MSDEYSTISIGGATIVQIARQAAIANPVPTVTRRQALRALHAAGLLDDIEAAIEALTEPQRSAARIDWAAAAEFRRDFPLLLDLAAAIGLTEAQIDELFAAAAAIT